MFLQFLLFSKLKKCTLVTHHHKTYPRPPTTPRRVTVFMDIPILHKLCIHVRTIDTEVASCVFIYCIANRHKWLGFNDVRVFHMVSDQCGVRQLVWILSNGVLVW